MLRVGILGAGGMGNTHARQYRKMSDVELTFYDPNPDKREAYSQAHSCSACSSPEELIDKVDVVDVCLPNDLHLEFGLKAISAGRAVFMEKPIARTLEDGVQLLHASERAGVPFMVGQVVRYFPEFRTGNRIVSSGGIGTPAAARTRRGGSIPGGNKSSWFMDHHRSGGVLIDLAVHDFDWLRWTLGEVKHLYARSVGSKTMQGPDYALTTLSFDNSAVAHVEATWMDPSGFRTTFEVAGSGGMIEFDSRTMASLRIHLASGSRGESNLSPLDDPYYGELRDFLDAVRNGTPPPVTAYDGLMALSIALTALESAQSGQVMAPPREF